MTYPTLFMYSLCRVLKITYEMSSVSSEKFDINECKIARQSCISQDQNLKKTSICANKNILSRHTHAHTHTLEIIGELECK